MRGEGAPGWRGGRGGYTSSRKGLGLGCYPAGREHECVIRSFFRMITLRKEPIGQETKQPEALITVLVRDDKGLRQRSCRGDGCIPKPLPRPS